MSQEQIEDISNESLPTRLLKGLIEYYEKSDGIRVLTLLLHPIGGSLDFLLSGGAYFPKWRDRIESLVLEFRERLLHCEETKVDHDFARSEEFYGLVARVIHDLQSTWQKEKIGIFAQVLTGIITKPFSQDVQRERYLALVHELSLLHIAMLRLFWQKREKASNGKAIAILTAEEIAGRLRVSQTETEAFCADLMSRGLLFDPQVGLYDYKRGSYALHPSAYAFLELIKSHPED